MIVILQGQTMSKLISIVITYSIITENIDSKDSPISLVIGIESIPWHMSALIIKKKLYDAHIPKLSWKCLTDLVSNLSLN